LPNSKPSRARRPTDEIAASLNPAALPKKVLAELTGRATTKAITFNTGNETAADRLLYVDPKR